jgi:hypothetical protein
MELAYVPLSKRGYSDVAMDKACIDGFGVLNAGPPRGPLHGVSPSDQAWILDQIRREHFFCDGD